VPEPTVTPALDPLAIELLADLPPEVRRLVVEAFDRVDFEFGAVLMRDGDPADPYWVLTDGRVRVVRDGADGTERRSSSPRSRSSSRWRSRSPRS